MPLKPGSSKSTVSQNISEFHTGPTYEHTKAKFGKRKADAQAIAVAMSNARKYARGGSPIVPELTGKAVNKTGFAQKAATSSSLSNARKYAAKFAAGGAPSVPWWEKSAARGMMRGTMLHSTVPGRTDKLPIQVPSGSFVIPADVVSGLG